MTVPDVPDSFYWTNLSSGAALRCRPLDALAPHLFTTRQLALSSEADYEQLARKAKSKTRTPIRAEEVPERPGRSGARRNKRDDD